jgi:Icc protein
MKKVVYTLILSLCLLSAVIFPADASESILASGHAKKDAYASKEKPKLAFPVISDIHVQSWHTPSHEKFTGALNDLNEINPQSDALILNGDLTNGLPADYTKLKELLGQAPHSNNVWSTIGNHEYYKAWIDAGGSWNSAAFPNGETEKASLDRFLQFNGSNEVYYEKQIKGYSFIFLGSEEYRQSDPANLEDAYLSDTQLVWLKKTLKKRSEDKKPIFVFLHQPFPYTVSGTSFCCVNNRAIVQHEVLKNILTDYPEVIFFSGHTHWELKLSKTLVKDRFTMVNSSSVFQPWTDDQNGGEAVLGPQASEGLYVEAYKDKVVIKGRDFSNKRWIPEAEFTVPVGNSGEREEQNKE